MSGNDSRTRAEELFKKISKRANLHGRGFTMMALDDKQTIDLLEAELQKTNSGSMGS